MKSIRKLKINRGVENVCKGFKEEIIGAER